MNARQFFSAAALVATLAVPGLASAHGFDRWGDRDGRPAAVQMHDRRDDGRGMERPYQAPQFQAPVRQDFGRGMERPYQAPRFQAPGRRDDGRGMERPYQAPQFQAPVRQDHGRFERARRWFGR